jgi:hypothetical protein
LSHRFAPILGGDRALNHADGSSASLNLNHRELVEQYFAIVVFGKVGLDRILQRLGL